MSDEILGKVIGIVTHSYIVNEFDVKWSDEDDNGIDIFLKTAPLNDYINAKEYVNLVKKIRSSLMRGYNIHFTNKFSL